MGMMCGSTDGSGVLPHGCVTRVCNHGHSVLATYCTSPCCSVVEHASSQRGSRSLVDGGGGRGRGSPADADRFVTRRLTSLPLGAGKSMHGVASGLRP